MAEEPKRVGQRSGNCLESRWRANSQGPDQLQSAVWASKWHKLHPRQPPPECHSHQLCQKARPFRCMLSARHLSFLQKRLSSPPERKPAANSWIDTVARRLRAFSRKLGQRVCNWLNIVRLVALAISLLQSKDEDGNWILRASNRYRHASDDLSQTAGKR